MMIRLFRLFILSVNVGWVITPDRLPILAIKPVWMLVLRKLLIFDSAFASCFGSTRYRAAFLSASNSTFMSICLISLGTEKPHTTANKMENAKVVNEGKKRYNTSGNVPNTNHTLVNIRFLKFADLDWWPKSIR